MTQEEYNQTPHTNPYDTPQPSHYIHHESEQNKKQQQRIVQLEEKFSSTHPDQETIDLKEELKKMKSENKILKEKEAKIKTKIERLSVKLEQIHY